MRECDVCDEGIIDGFYHEDSGDIVCGEECGRKHFEGFDDRTEELEIFWTTFE